MHFVERQWVQSSMVESEISEEINVLPENPGGDHWNSEPKNEISISMPVMKKLSFFRRMVAVIIIRILNLKMKLALAVAVMRFMKLRLKMIDIKGSSIGISVHLICKPSIHCLSTTFK